MADAAHTRRIIVAISGASGAVYGARLLQVLQGQSGIETHLVVSDAGWRNLQHELDMDRPAVEVPTQGVHALCGPSGAGKTSMLGRLAYAAAQTHGADQYADQNESDDWRDAEAGKGGNDDPCRA